MSEQLRAAGFHRAERETRLARILIEGPQHAGKTQLGLTWAWQIAAPSGSDIAVIDTDHRRAAMFAGDAHAGPEPPFEFFHHCWEGPFDPARLVSQAQRAADALGPDGVVMIDTVTPFWNGKGGVTDIVDNSAEAWKVGGPVHRDMVDALTRLPCHLIVTVRSKVEWVIEEVARENLKMHTARPIGVGPDQRSGFQFDFDVYARVDADHYVTVTGSGLPFAWPVVSGSESWRFGADYAASLGYGVQRISPLQRAQLASLIDEVTDPADRADLRRLFMTAHGMTGSVTVDRYDQVTEWVSERVNRWLAGEPFEPVAADPDQPPPDEPPAQEPEPEEPEPNEPEDPDEQPDGLLLKGRDSLVAIADTFGIQIDGRWSDATLRTKIREAMDAVDPPAIQPEAVAS